MNNNLWVWIVLLFSVYKFHLAGWVIIGIVLVIALVSCGLLFIGLSLVPEAWLQLAEGLYEHVLLILSVRLGLAW